MNVKKCVRALLCLYLTLIIATDAAKAQALKVGDTIPPELWSMPLNVINHPEGKETITLSEHKDKLIILDFWATWCAPCIAMLPKQDSLQKQFKDKIQIIPVTYQTEAEVSTFMEKFTKRTGKKNSLPKVVGDNVFRVAFPHTYLPHYVWIDAEGKVIAITGHEEIKADKISNLLETKGSNLTLKEDPTPVAYSKDYPLYINGNGGTGEGLLYHSLLQGYSPGLPPGYNIVRDSSYSRIVARNLPLDWLLRLSHGEEGFLGRNRVVRDVRDPEKLASKLSGKAYQEWLENNAISYEIMIPAYRDSELHELMRQDLRKYFPQYSFGLEKRETMCLVIKQTAESKDIRSNGGEKRVNYEYGTFTVRNQKIAVLVGYLNVLAMQKSPYPVVDGTGLTETVDLDLEADLSDIDDLNRALKPYGLIMEKDQRVIDILVVKDK